MKYVRYIVAAVLLILIVTGVSVQQAKSSETAYLLDTIIQVTAYGVGKSEAVRAAVSRIEEIDATFSAYPVSYTHLKELHEKHGLFQY